MATARSAPPSLHRSHRAHAGDDKKKNGHDNPPPDDAGDDPGDDA